MERLEKYFEIIRQILIFHAPGKSSDSDIECQQILDLR
jgi:hypothetical protein